jgi:hypothetical protein
MSITHQLRLQLDLGHDIFFFLVFGGKTEHLSDEKNIKVRKKTVKSRFGVRLNIMELTSCLGL